MSSYARVADLPLRIDGYELRGLSRRVSSGFTRHTTVVRMFAGTAAGAPEGLGEDVTYDPVDHEVVQERGAVHDLRGEFTLASFSARLASLDLFPEPPERTASHDYRRWAFESAALDLALRQNGATLAEALGREPRDVRYVVSLRLPEPPSLAPLVALRATWPNMRFKLDPTPSFSRALLEQLHALDAVDVLDLKAFYENTPVDNPADLRLYRDVCEALPGAWIEDPLLSPQTLPILEPYLDRVTWDAPIHSIADIEALAHRPRTLNFKPSRFGTVERLFDAYDWCAQHGIAIYGGGQFELGPGRAQIQYLASLFHANAPNDVAPAGFHDSTPAGDLKASPIEAAIAFGRREA